MILRLLKYSVLLFLYTDTLAEEIKIISPSGIYTQQVLSFVWEDSFGVERYEYRVYDSKDHLLHTEIIERRLICWQGICIHKNLSLILENNSLYYWKLRIYKNSQWHRFTLPLIFRVKR